MLDQVMAYISKFIDEVYREFAWRDAQDWFLMFLPVFVIWEIPRYYFPMWGLVLATKMGIGKRDRHRENAFLSKAPKVSVIIAGRNEEDCIENAIRSLLDQNYPNFEIIVVDDNSEDQMYERANRFAKKGLIRLVRNSAQRGRSGRPSATNLGVRLANGEFIVSVDADCSFDRNMIREAVAPFADPKVGVVAGNVHVRNADVNLLTRLQVYEYIVAIDIRKRWTDLFGCTLQASGALGAFRKSAIDAIWGWDQELAEDGDISLRIVKAGWKIKFAPDAVALTEVPESMKVLKKQRGRWDRGTLRTYFRKHGRLLLPQQAGWSFAIEMWTQFLFFVVASLIYPFFIVWLLWQSAALFVVIMIASMIVYCILSVLTLLSFSLVSDRLENTKSLFLIAVLTPFFKEIFRWVRIKALVLEIFRISYTDTFLPDSAWNRAPRF